MLLRARPDSRQPELPDGLDGECDPHPVSIFLTTAAQRTLVTSKRGVKSNAILCQQILLATAVKSIDEHPNNNRVFLYRRCHDTTHPIGAWIQQ